MGTIGSKSMGCQIWQRGSMAALGSRTEYICPHPLNLVFPFSASAMRAIPPMDLEEGSQVTQPVQDASSCHTAGTGSPRRIIASSKGPARYTIPVLT